MAYSVQNWVDGVGGGTPVNATRLGHIEAGLSDHETRLAAVEDDSGWVTITVNGTYVANGTPTVRKIGKVVRANAGVNSTGMAINTQHAAVMTVPLGYRPDKAQYVPAGTSTGSQTAQFVINTDGTIDIKTGAALSTYYRLDAVSWFVA